MPIIDLPLRQTCTIPSMVVHSTVNHRGAQSRDGLNAGPNHERLESTKRHMTQLTFMRVLSLLIALSGLVANTHAGMLGHSAPAVMHAVADDSHAHVGAHEPADDTTTLSAVDCCQQAMCSGAAVLQTATLTFLATSCSKTFAATNSANGRRYPPLLRPPR